MTYPYVGAGTGDTAANRASSGAYGPMRTGTPSSWGQYPAPKTILNPWGNNFPMPLGKMGVGFSTTTGLNSTAGSSRKMPTPDPQLFSMSYATNDPLAWPIVGGKRGSISGMTQAKADWWNSAVNHAYFRTTGLS